MYGICTYILLHKHQPNVGKYSIKLMVPVPSRAGSPTFRRIDAAPVRSQVSSLKLHNEELHGITIYQYWKDANGVYFVSICCIP